MQVIIVKDGTVPIAVAKVVETDGEDGKNLDAYLTKHDTDPWLVESFTVNDDTRFLFVGWSEGDGFDAIGFGDLGKALDYLNEDADPDQVANSNLNGRHWAITYNEAEDGEGESYGHVFTLLN